MAAAPDGYRGILHAAAADTNPKRKRGSQTSPSLTLRVRIECLIPRRQQYSEGDGAWHKRLTSAPAETDFKKKQIAKTNGFLWRILRKGAVIATA
jgi:hypothetical protein